MHGGSDGWFARMLTHGGSGEQKPPHAMHGGSVCNHFSDNPSQ
jgi:hypothetical protein